MVYYGLVALAFGAALLARRSPLWLVLSAAFFLAAFRFGVGNDYFSYAYIFNELEANPVIEIAYGSGVQEIGFRVAGSSWKAVGLGYPTFVAACALINLSFVALTCRRFSPNPTLSFALYLSFHYLTWTLSGMRQGVTIAIGMHFLLVALEKNDRKSSAIFWGVVVTLTTVHASAVVLGLMYLLARTNIRRSTMTLLGVAAVAVALVPTSFIVMAVQRTPLLNRAAPYIGRDDASVLDFQGLVRLFLLLFVLVFYNLAVSGSPIRRLIVQLYILSFVLYFGLQVSELLAARVSIYGRYLDILVFPFMLYSLRAGAARAVAAIALTIYALAYVTKDLQVVESNFAIRGQSTESWWTPYTHHWNKGEFHFDMGRYAHLR